MPCSCGKSVKVAKPIIRDPQTLRPIDPKKINQKDNKIQYTEEIIMVTVRKKMLSGFIGWEKNR